MNFLFKLSLFVVNIHFPIKAFAIQSQLQIWDAHSKEISQRIECDNTIDFIKVSGEQNISVFVLISYL